MADYPDYTELMQIIGSDIMVPMDIQAAYIMMPVDIQAQYITLDIDITAQTIEKLSIDIVAQTIESLDINLAASDITLDINILTSAITLNVDITAQTIGDIDFNINAQNVGIYLQPDWTVLKGTHKTFRCFGDDVAFSTSATADYPVPGGKTLYVTYACFSICASNSADADKPQIGKLVLLNYTDTLFYGELGGNGGGSLVYPSPIKIPGGKTLRLGVSCKAAHDCDIIADCGGYEL